MSASTTPMTPSTSVYTTPVFWERLWRGSGVQAGRHHMAERWIMGTRWRLYALHLAYHRPPVGAGREPRPPGPSTSHARGVVRDGRPPPFVSEELRAGLRLLRT